jgi:hypothetical protein
LECAVVFVVNVGSATAGAPPVVADGPAQPAASEPELEPAPEPESVAAGT